MESTEWFAVTLCEQNLYTRLVSALAVMRTQCWVQLKQRLQPLPANKIPNTTTAINLAMVTKRAVDKIFLMDAKKIIFFAPLRAATLFKTICLNRESGENPGQYPLL